MRYCRNRIQTLIKGLVVLFFYIFLTGQDLIRGREPVTPTKFDPDMFKFDQPQTLAVKMAEYFYYSWVFGLLLLVIVFLIFYKKYDFQQKLKYVKDQQAAFQFNALLSQLRISPELSQILEKMVGSSDPKKILAVVESVKKFEKKVKAFKRQKPDLNTLSQIFSLRKQLGFEFSNLDIPFISTRMLSPTMELKCILPHSDKSAVFTIPILAVEEDRILLKPPSFKGKPVDLRKFPYLLCQIRREGLMAYQFKLRIIDQLTEEFSPVVLEHTHKIRKLIIRESQRIPVFIPSTFHMLSEELLSNHSGKYRHLRLEMALPQFEGEVTDISTGGLKVVAKELPSDLNEKHLLLFHLKGAELRDDLVVRITRLIDHEQGYELHGQFLHLRDLVRFKINKFIHRTQKK